MGDRGREPSPRVLVLGASFGIALPVARCLDARGIAVDMATSTRHQPRVRSRAVRSFERLPDSRAEPVAFRRRLLELCRAEDYGLLIPAGDSALAAVRRNFQSLRELVPVGCPEPRKLEAVLDKGRTLDLASSLDVPVPATCTVEAGDGLGHVVQALDFPVVVKPRDKYGESSLKVEHFRSPAGLEDWFRTWQQSPGAARELHVQEFVPGHGVLVLALTAAGTPMTPVLQQVRLKEYPPSGGLTVRGRIERPSAPFDGWALRLFRELEWTGPVAAEFRHDPDAGRVVLLELNGRYWASLDLTLRAGVDLPFYHWRMSRGEKIEAAPPVRWGTRARWLAGDLRREYRLMADRHQSFPPTSSAAEGLFQLVADFVLPVHDMMWRVRDPIPALQDLARTSVDLLRRGTAALWARVGPGRH